MFYLQNAGFAGALRSDDGDSRQVDLQLTLTWKHSRLKFQRWHSRDMGSEGFRQILYGEIVKFEKILRGIPFIHINYFLIARVHFWGWIGSSKIKNNFRFSDFEIFDVRYSPILAISFEQRLIFSISCFMPWFVSGSLILKNLSKKMNKIVWFLVTTFLFVFCFHFCYIKFFSWTRAIFVQRIIQIKNLKVLTVLPSANGIYLMMNIEKQINWIEWIVTWSAFEYKKNF